MMPVMSPDQLLEAGRLDDYLLAIRAKKDGHIARLLACNGGQPAGLCARSARRDFWAVVLPEMSDPNSGEARIQRFDRRGWVGHSVFLTFDDAVEGLVQEGFVVFDPDALDEVAVGFECAHVS
jgi:hypothetical protein